MRKTLSLILTFLLLCSLLLTSYAAGEDPSVGPEERVEETEPLDPKIEAMLACALEIAADDSHGYSQSDRFGPNYDCTSFISTALMEGGFELEDYLSTGGLIDVLPDYGFAVYRRGETEPQRGDILVQRGVHAEICMGDGGCVAAHRDYDWRSGDWRTGHEIEYRTGDDDYGCPFCAERHYGYILRYITPDSPQCVLENEFRESRIR
jgi:hypothetical protein